MLKHRLIFGTLMSVLFLGLIYLDGVICISIGEKLVSATILTVLLGLIAIPANIELSALIRKRQGVVFLPITIISSLLLATSWYWRQYFERPFEFHLLYLLFVIAFTVIAIFLYQGRKYGTDGTIINGGVNLFAIFYLGFLSSFMLGIRIEFGIWAMLMAIFTVKSADIGAYTLGKLFGKHKFSPRISPGKTWEGMLGGVIFATITAFAFSYYCDIMRWYQAMIFGAMFAFLGQFGDLAESMIKRDAQEKDSASNVPGFGGVLDVIDSPIFTAPLAYLYFMLTVV